MASRLWVWSGSAASRVAGGPDEAGARVVEGSRARGERSSAFRSTRAQTPSSAEPHEQPRIFPGALRFTAPAFPKKPNPLTRTDHGAGNRGREEIHHPNGRATPKFTGSAAHSNPNGRRQYDQPPT
ncbi:hypothetical protein GCM10010428_59670 [Actinosynnema pretiosum subsp. pretiosum]